MIFEFKLISVIYIILSICFMSWAQESSGPIVDAGILGKIQGSISSTIGRNSRSYAQYLGIPYAQKATRFMPSQLLVEPLNNTTSPFNATQFGIECPQPNPQYSGSEDCLFLNLFSPHTSEVTNSTKRYPVLVMIHGAAFVSGNANMYTGARLLNRDVILISFNYRLGVFGFYNLETTTAPGNAALYDARTVLQWVQMYAHHFGGDPSQVTLVGQSSGSATVAHMALSPLCKGLFHRIIAASGSALDIWATSAAPLAASLQVAGYAGCFVPGSILNKTQVMDCMLNKTQAELSTAQNLFQFMDMKSGSIGFAAVSPSVQEVAIPEIETIIPQHPAVVLEAGNQNNVSVMMGVTRDDGGFALRLVREGYILTNDLINDTSFLKEKLVPTIFTAIGVSDPANTIANTFRDIYMEEKAGASGNFSIMVPSLIDMLGVIFFKSASYRTVQSHSKIASDIYFYSFDYEGRYTRHPENAGFPGGVAHADDLQYIFQLTDALNEEEQALSDVMVDYWINFVYTGNPNTYPEEAISSRTVPTWPKFDESGNEYLIIDANIKQSSNYPKSWVIENKLETVCQNSAMTSFKVVLLFPLLVLAAFVNKMGLLVII